MRVSDQLVEERRRRISLLLDEQKYLGVCEICEKLGISEATARRDLAVLEAERKIQRTFGGAVAFYNDRFPSFRQRLTRNLDGKRAVSAVAREMIAPGQTLFFDSGTTVFLLAELLAKSPVCPLAVVTGNLPVAELLSEVDGVEVHLLGGRVVVRQSVLLGPASRAGLEQWKIDIAFLSAEGADARGLWNSQEEIVLSQRVAIARSTRPVILLDRSKIGTATDYFLAPWAPPIEMVTDAPVSVLRKAGLPGSFLGGVHVAKSGIPTPGK